MIGDLHGNASRIKMRYGSRSIHKQDASLAGRRLAPGGKDALAKEGRDRRQ
jgi:hypothetical protein